MLNFIKKFKENSEQNKLKKQIKRAQDKIATTETRYAAFDTLKKIGTTAAILGLIGRFAFNYDKSIVDKEEKEYVLNILIDFNARAIEPLKQFIQNNYTIGWPAQTLSKLIPEKELLDYLILQISTEEYLFDEKENDKRLELLNLVANYKNELLIEKAIKLLSDEDDRVKLKVIEILETQKDEKAREPLLNMLTDNNMPIRLKTRIFEAFTKTDWTVSGFRKKVEEILPQGYYINKEGQIRLRTSN
jgi:HEAT repeat protein